MRLLILSDTQIGSGTSLVENRTSEQAEMLTQIADLADRERVDLVLHCGDVFDKRHPSEEARLTFKRFAARVTAERPLLIAAGNHDLRHADLPSAVDLYDDCAFVRQPAVRQFGDLFVAMLPWVPLARRVADRNGDRGGIYEETAALLVDAAADLRAQCDGIAILALHWMLSGARLPNGLPVEQLRSVVLPTSALQAQGWDAIFAGDIHVPENLGTDAAPVVSCGSPWVNDFGEAEIEHGVWLYDTETRDLRFEPVEDAHRFVTVDVDLTEIQERPDHYIDLDETDLIASTIAEHFPFTDAVVRVRYRCTAEQARRVDAAALRTLLADAGVWKVYSIQADVVRGDRARVEGVDESMDELDALEAWITANFQSMPAVRDQARRVDALRDLTASFLEEAAA